MIDPNKPIIDTRSTVVEGRPSSTVPTVGVDTSNPPSPQSTPVETISGKESNPPSPPTAPTETTSGDEPDNWPSISSSIPKEYTASSYDDIIPLIESAVNEYKPLTQEEVAKLRKRKKAEGIIAGISDAVRSVANLVATANYAPDMSKDTESMSARTKQRWDKEKAEYEANREKALKYALMLGQMRDADKQRGLDAWKTEQTLARQDRAYADDKAFKAKDYDERVRQWQENFDRQGKWHDEEGKRWERQFKESVRQYNTSSAMERERINLAAQQAAIDVQKGQMTFNLGPGNGNVSLTLDKLNAETVSAIFNTLPEGVRFESIPIKDQEGNVTGYYKKPKITGDPIVENGIVKGYQPPSTEAMLIAIGANVGGSPATQTAIKQVAGIEKGEKPKAYDY